MIAPVVPFALLLALMGAERLVELRLSRAHVAVMALEGGRVVATDGYGLIVGVHVAFFVGCVAEFLLSPRAGFWRGSAPFLALFFLAELFRFWAIVSLGERWSVRVVTMPYAPLVSRGPYRFMRHPNYVGVAVGLAAFPLAFGLYATALLITIANAVALARRIVAEERALGISRGKAAKL